MRNLPLPSGYQRPSNLQSSVGPAKVAMSSARVRPILRRPMPTAKGSMPTKKVGSYKKGGNIKKTGLAKVHKGERVLTKEQNKNFKKKK